MQYEIDIPAAQLAKYLQIAANQRKRAANKFIQDYGPQSATVTEVQAEIAELDLTINKIVKDAAKSPASAHTRK